MSLAEKLVTLRKQNGLTQMELAEKLNVSRQAVSRWEVGAAIPGMENLRAIGELYEVSVDCLLNDTVEEITVASKTESLAVCDKHLEDATKKKYRIILVVTLVCLLMTIVGAAIFSKFYREPNSCTPVSDLDTENKEGYATESFDIEW